MNRYLRLVFSVGILLLVLVAIRSTFPGPLRWNDGSERIPYNQFVEKVKLGNVISKGRFQKEIFEGEYLSTPGVADGKKRFTVVVPPEASPARADLIRLLQEKNVTFEFATAPFSDMIVSVLLTVLLPLALIFMFWIFFLRQAQAGGNQALNFGKARARRMTDNVPKVTFEDVAGVDEAKQELQEIVEFLKNAKKFQALGAKIPKGVLLLGPPGSGKTLLARAIAGEAGVPFFHISGSDFVEMFVGVGASRVRDLFETAKQNRPALIFIDEIDAVGRQRGAGWGGGHDEREQTLNQLLVEMDGFDPNAGVILIAATNRPDVLDPALLRPGRFDRRVVVDAPDFIGRKAILGVHTRGKPLSEDVNVENLARRTPGFSGADLANLVNESALLAARREKTRIEMADFNDAIDRVIAGPERKSRVMNEKDKERIAYHELGHAIIQELLPLADPVHKVSILPRGRALGYTMALPTEDKYLVTRQEFLDQIASLLGGRVAEELVYNEVTTGASNDLDRATDMARAMVTEYGMSDKLGPLKIGNRHGSPFLGRDMYEDRNYSEEVASIVDKEVRAIIDECYETARKILVDNRDKMDEMSQVLLEKESIEREEFLLLLEGSRVPEGRTRRENPFSQDPPSPDTRGAGDTPESTERPVLRPRLEPGMA